MATSKAEPDIGRRILWGILLVALSVFLALSLFSYDWRDIGLLHAPPNAPPVNLFGPVGAWLSYFLFMVVGIGAYALPPTCLALGLILMLNRQARVWPRLLWCLALLVGIVCVLQLDEATWRGLTVKHNLLPDAGGLLGHLLMTRMLARWLSPVGAGLVAWSLILVAAVLTAGVHNLVRGARLVMAGAVAAAGWIGTAVVSRLDERQRLEKEERQLERKRRRLEKSLAKEAGRKGRSPAADKPAADEPHAATIPEPRVPDAERKARLPRLPRKPAPEPEPETAVEPLPRTPTTFSLPGVELLDKAVAGRKDGIKADTGTTARLLVETLAEFGIEGDITNVQVGPVVTSYELLPAPGVRVERISGLSNNLALSLKATSVRVQAPIPGKGVVGIEVPNTVSQLVPLRQIMEGDAWAAGKARLPLVLGKDVGGNDIVADLAAMPHLLIAGATGAGKTVCMNSILAGLLMSRTPEELRLMLIDPKIVEFSVYNKLPHLVVPVITDPKKVGLGLRWAINEMERRYKLFAKVGVRNIDSYNSRTIATQERLFDDEPPAAPRDEPPARVPYVVIVIDELADLMLSDQAEIENCIARLAQLSRAVGIHMIIATQRPSVNVITGTIKANFPARIAFQVAQRVDSRTILDSVGAEKLLGRGDMLYMAAGSSKLVRVQGAMTSDDEIRAIAEFLREQGEPDYEVAIKETLDKAAGADSESTAGDEDEDLLNKSIDVIRETRRASTSSLQRRLRIGYTRAARIMDILEERGMLGPPRGSEPREILIDLDGDIPNNDNTGDEDV